MLRPMTLKDAWFATRIVKLSGQLRHDPESRHIASQILRSGTAAAPNYAEARSAESRADFIHKLKIALKELNETSIWLRVIKGSFGENSDFLSGLVAENQELCKILLASIQKARRNSRETGPGRHGAHSIIINH
jgi:four helix bundle protein